MEQNNGITFERLPQAVEELKCLIEERFEETSRLIGNINSTNQGTQADEILNVKQVCELLDMSRAYVYSLVSRKEIPHHRIGKKILFIRNDIITWIREAKILTDDELQEEIRAYEKKHKRF